jgi:hypothetical protein
MLQAWPTRCPKNIQQMSGSSSANVLWQDPTFAGAALSPIAPIAQSSRDAADDAKYVELSEISATTPLSHARPDPTSVG